MMWDLIKPSFDNKPHVICQSLTFIHIYCHSRQKLDRIQAICCQRNSTVAPPTAVNQWLRHKLVKHYAMKTYGEGKCSYTILDLSTHAPPTLVPSTHWTRGCVGPSQSGSCGEEQILLPQQGIEPMLSIQDQ
jgi:hypothetical protein